LLIYLFKDIEVKQKVEICKESTCEANPCEETVKQCSFCASSLNLASAINSCSIEELTAQLIPQSSSVNSDLKIRQEVFEIMQNSSFDLSKFPGYDVNLTYLEIFDDSITQGASNLTFYNQTDLRIRLFNFMTLTITNSTWIDAINSNNQTLLAPFKARFDSQV